MLFVQAGRRTHFTLSAPHRLLLPSLITCCCVALFCSKPLYIDLDVGQNAISIPGAIAATSVEDPVSSEQAPIVPHCMQLAAQRRLCLPATDASPAAVCLLSTPTLSPSKLPSPTTTATPRPTSPTSTNSSSHHSPPPSPCASRTPPPPLDMAALPPPPPYEQVEGATTTSFRFTGSRWTNSASEF